jgi:hypothetical protein
MVFLLLYRAFDIGEKCLCCLVRRIIGCQSAHLSSLQRSFTRSLYRFLSSIAAADTASTSRVSCGAGDFAPSGPEQHQASYQLIFFLDLPAQAVHFDFLRWTNFEATCC